MAKNGRLCSLFYSNQYGFSLGKLYLSDNSQNIMSR